MGANSLKQGGNETSIDSGYSADMHGNDDQAPEWVLHYMKEGMSIQTLIPPLEWVPRYMRSVKGVPTAEDERKNGTLAFSVSGDLIAGTTVAIMLVPQGLAFAMLAGLPVQIGLYSSFLPLVVYVCFGTFRQMQVGPTALVSLLAGQALDGMALDSELERIAGASLLALLVGLISISLGLLRTGFIVDFMSHSVMTAFCTAAGITIGTSQLKHLFGLHVPREKYWWKTIKGLVMHVSELHWPTVIEGFTLLVLLLTLKYWKSAGSKDRRSKHALWRFFPKDKASRPFRALKLVADLSSLLCVTVGWLWALAYRSAGVEGVALVGDVDSSGLIAVMPGAGYFDRLVGGGIFQSAAIIAVVGFLETIAVGGKFAAEARYDYDPNQELIALGASNVASAFMSGFPVTGGFSRTVVNVQFGATSLFACGITSFLVLLAAYLLLPVIALLPLCSLAPIIIQGAIGVVSFSGFHKAYESSPPELIIMLATLIMSLALTVKEGLLVGFVLSILKTMYDLANPNIAVLARLEDGQYRDIRNFPRAQQAEGVVVVRMDARINFANARILKEFCLRAMRLRGNKGERIDYLVLDCKPTNDVDMTGAEMLEVLAQTCQSQGGKLILTNLKGPVGKVLQRCGVPTGVRKHGGHICIDMREALAIIAQEDPAGSMASERFRDLMQSVEEAQVLLNSAKGSSLPFACGPKTGAAPAHPGSPRKDPTDVRPSPRSDPDVDVESGCFESVPGGL